MMFSFFSIGPFPHPRRERSNRKRWAFCLSPEPKRGERREEWILAVPSPSDFHLPLRLPFHFPLPLRFPFPLPFPLDPFPCRVPQRFGCTRSPPLAAHNCGIMELGSSRRFENGEVCARVPTPC
jgi:hypothetical protein